MGKQNVACFACLTLGLMKIILEFTTFLRGLRALFGDLQLILSKKINHSQMVQH